MWWSRKPDPVLLERLVLLEAEVRAVKRDMSEVEDKCLRWARRVAREEKGAQPGVVRGDPGGTDQLAGLSPRARALYLRKGRSASGLLFAGEHAGRPVGDPPGDEGNGA
jgi:hypothetical protein